MKSKEEILNSFYTQGDDGMPEISAANLLSAMDVYKQEAVEAAFNAARLLNDGFASQQAYRFETIADYIKSIEETVSIEPKDNFSEVITLVADSILPNFLPHDNSINQLSFDFPMKGIDYTAFYIKDAEGYWQLNNWQLVSH